MIHLPTIFIQKQKLLRDNKNEAMHWHGSVQSLNRTKLHGANQIRLLDFALS